MTLNRMSERVSRMAEHQHDWNELKTDPFWYELRLFIRSLFPGRFTRGSGSGSREPNCWPGRCDDWETHVTLFALTKCDLGPNSASSLGTERSCNANNDGDPAVSRGKSQSVPWNATRIEFLFQHLTILDTKFGISLTFNSLLLLAINVLINILLNLLKSDGHFIEVPHIYRTLLVSLTVSFGLSWILTTLLCLWGERRLVWGDLGLLSQGNRLQLGRLTSEKIKEAEQKHVEALIMAVVKRSNKFRIVIVLTFVNVLILAGSFLTALLLLSQVFPNFW